MAGGRLTEAENKMIRKLHAAGKGRNDIAKELGRSGQTISRAAERLGITFERGPEVAAATAAKVADAKARRAQLQLDLLDDAERLRQQLFAKTTAFNFGGRDNTYNETELNEPTFGDKRNIVQAVSAAISTSIRIDEHDKEDTSLSGLDAWLANLAGDA